MLRRMSASRTAVDYVRLIEVARDSRTRHLEIVLIKSQYTVRKTQIVSRLRRVRTSTLCDSQSTEADAVGKFCW